MDFYKTWAEYKAGFGEVDGEHWLGNDNIHTLSNNMGKTYELRIDMNDGLASRYATYDMFTISDETDKYRLTLGSYAGDAGKYWSELH